MEVQPKELAKQRLRDTGDVAVFEQTLEVKNVKLCDVLTVKGDEQDFDGWRLYFEFEGEKYIGFIDKDKIIKR